MKSNIVITLRQYNAKYDKTVHLFKADNPRLFNAPPRGNEGRKLEYNAKTPAENKIGYRSLEPTNQDSPVR